MDRQWRAFTQTLLVVCILIPLALYLFIVIVDPFDNLPLSPDWTRVQVTGTERYFKPSLARRPRYDSVLVGASTSMLLHTGRLNAAFGRRFTTLSMPAASPFEQMRLLKLFHKHHPDLRMAMVAIDPVWCMPSGAPKQLGANVGQRDPVWLYDENHWNDWPRLGSQELKYARRQAKAMLQRDHDPAAVDGYYNFTEQDYGAYDFQRAMRHLYNGRKPIPRPLPVPPLELDPAELASWEFPDLQKLHGILAGLPADSTKILLFTPIHWYAQAQPGTQLYAELEECKRRVAAFARDVPQLYAIDFMLRSPITLTDSNYWDGLHFKTEIADYLVQTLEAVLRGERTAGENFRYIALPDGS